MTRKKSFGEQALKKTQLSGTSIAGKVRRAGNWLIENKKPRNYIFYAANLALNPFKGIVGLAGRVYEDVATTSYKYNANLVNIGRVGLAAITLMDVVSYSGIAETFGDVLLTAALFTDTNLQEISVDKTKEDVGNLVSKFKRLD